MNHHTNRHHYEELVVDALAALKAGKLNNVILPFNMLMAQDYMGDGAPALKEDGYDLAAFEAAYPYLLELDEWTDELAWENHQKAVKAHNDQWEAQGKAAYEAAEKARKEAEANNPVITA